MDLYTPGLGRGVEMAVSAADLLLVVRPLGSRGFIHMQTVIPRAFIRRLHAASSRLFFDVGGILIWLDLWMPQQPPTRHAQVIARQQNQRDQPKSCAVWCFQHRLLPPPNSLGHPKPFAPSRTNERATRTVQATSDDEPARRFSSENPGAPDDCSSCSLYSYGRLGALWVAVPVYGRHAGHFLCTERSAITTH